MKNLYLVSIYLTALALASACGKSSTTSSTDSYTGTDGTNTLTYTVVKNSDGTANSSCTANGSAKAYGVFNTADDATRYSDMCVIVFDSTNTQSDFWQIDDKNGTVSATNKSGSVITLNHN